MFMRRVLGCAAAVVALAVSCGIASAEECTKPLSLIASIDLVPVTDDRMVVIPVTVGGKEKFLQVDTGGAFTEMSPEVADELGLPRTHSGRQVFDVSGMMSDEIVHTSLKMGNLTADDMVFQISAVSHDSGDARLAGLLAPDILKHYDLDLDFGQHKFNLLSQDHCEGKVVYWKADVVAVVPMKVMAGGHILLTVQVDGKDVTAALDTGAWNTTLSEPVAESTFGLKPADMEKTGTLPQRDGAATYRHTFKTLGLEGIAVSNPTIDVIPDFNTGLRHENATATTGSHLSNKGSDETAQAMLLGMDVLRHFHIYIAYKEQKLYISPK
jgi:predicted aspartyl protease